MPGCSNGTWLGQPEDGCRNPPLTLRENHNVATGWSQNHGDKKVSLTPWEFNINKSTPTDRKIH